MRGAYGGGVIDLALMIIAYVGGWLRTLGAEVKYWVLAVCCLLLAGCAGWEPKQVSVTGSAAGTVGASLACGNVTPTTGGETIGMSLTIVYGPKGVNK
jgi:hypothetical protein